MHVHIAAFTVAGTIYLDLDDVFNVVKYRMYLFSCVDIYYFSVFIIIFLNIFLLRFCVYSLLVYIV